MLHWLGVMTHLVVGLVRSQADLAIENAALRQQLAVFEHKRPRPKLGGADRLFWVLLRRLWSGWVDALIIVKPQTVIRWHRAGFRRYWRWKSRKLGRPRMDPSIRTLVRRMARDNDWGAPRIHAELLKLGYEVGERTVSRWLPRKPAGPDAVDLWKAFLRNHRDAIGAMDFLTVPTATFNVLYVFFVIGHARRRILHVNVTSQPTANWVVQQLREAFPFESSLRHLVLDRDAIFSERVKAAIKSMGMKPTLIGYRSPWQNGVAERWVGSVRRELLDHVVVFNERHLRRLVRAYVAYYNEDRCHLSNAKDPPLQRPAMEQPSATAEVIAIPRVGGLHHRYEWRDRRDAA